VAFLAPILNHEGLRAGEAATKNQQIEKGNFNRKEHIVENHKYLNLRDLHDFRG
jgi:hypothetical protein